MFDESIKTALKLYIEVFNSLKKHCNKSECKNCHFNSTFGVCIMERKPFQYNIEQIENAVLGEIINEFEEESNK